MRSIVPWALWGLIACRSGQIADTPTDSDTPVDSDTDTPVETDSPVDTGESVVEEGPCGPGAPLDCVEIRDRACWVPQVPAWLQRVRPLTDEDIDFWITYALCEYSAFETCADLISMTVVAAGGVAMEPSGQPRVETPLGWEPYGPILYDADSRLMVGLALVKDPDSANPACDYVYYGEERGLGCIQPSLETLYVGYRHCQGLPGYACYNCSEHDPPCDLCACNVNTVTDAVRPGCEG